MASGELTITGEEAHRKEQTTTVKVKGAVDGMCCLITVDTGAEKTIVHPKWIMGKVEDNSKWLCGVTGHLVPLSGPINVTIGLGSSQVVWPVYVSEIQD